jgi:hypothetical protein
VWSALRQGRRKMASHWNQARIQQYINDEIEESVTLDYKAAGSLGKRDGKKGEISKDVSAMANAAGGTIIYGVSEYQEPEKGHLPQKIDPVDRTMFSKEWLEQVINSNVHPKIEGLVIHPVDISSSTSAAVYVVEVPQSTVAHQARDFRYYKRYNFESVPMLDYEINDVRNRRTTVQILVTFEVTMKHSAAVFLTVRNIGSVSARDVSFEIRPALVWSRSEIPPIFARGIHVFPPGREYHFFYQTYADILNKDEIPNAFDVEVSYFHPDLNQRISDDVHVDFTDYKLSSTLKSELLEHADILKIRIEALTKELKRLGDNFNSLPELTGATGLNLSYPTLENLRHLVAGDDQFRAIDPYFCKANVFKEILDVEWNMAYRLEHFFRVSRNDCDVSQLEDLPGMTRELLDMLYKHFAL